jgi:UV DNA damage endonuclease
MTQPGAMGASRLGFPVKVLGRPGLKSNDSRRWQSGPHLRVSLEHLSRIFDYLDERDIWRPMPPIRICRSSTA